ncbi:MAG: hypothetical protein C0423_21080 [Methylibium sp.]|nr:hypothetical protein [Methylibium sp.]
MSDVLLQLQQDSPLLVAVFDAGDVLRHANAAYRQAYALEPEACPSWTEQMHSRHQAGLGQLIHTDDFEAWLALALARRRSQPYRAFELELVDGRRIWMTETLHASGWLLCVGSDLSGLRVPAGSLAGRADDGLRVPELTDPRSTLQALQRLLPLDEAWPLSVAMLALDAGPAGEAQEAAELAQARQREFGRHLQACIRREDACGRLNEQHHYLLILPNAGPGQARAIVERLLTRMRYALAKQAGPAPGGSCSAGLVQANWGESAETVLQRVAHALELARAAGGDQLVADEA